MSYIFNDYTFAINKTEDNINISVVCDSITFEKNIIPEDLSNSMTLDKFNSFIIKCLERKENYNIELINNNDHLSINLSFNYEEINIFQNIILKLNTLTDEERNIEIHKLKQENKELKKQIDIISEKMILLEKTISDSIIYIDVGNNKYSIYSKCIKIDSFDDIYRIRFFPYIDELDINVDVLFELYTRFCYNLEKFSTKYVDTGVVILHQYFKYICKLNIFNISSTSLILKLLNCLIVNVNKNIFNFNIINIIELIGNTPFGPLCNCHINEVILATGGDISLNKYHDIYFSDDYLRIYNYTGINANRSYCNSGHRPTTIIDSKMLNSYNINIINSDHKNNHNKKLYDLVIKVFDFNNIKYKIIPSLN